MKNMFSFQGDDIHVTVPHSHVSDPDSVEMQKLKVSMRENIRCVRARPGQELVDGLLSSTQEVRAKVGRLDTVRRNLRR